MATMTKQARKKIWAFLALGAFTGLLFLPLFLSLPTGASGETPAPAAPAPAARPRLQLPMQSLWRSPGTFGSRLKGR